MNNGMLGFPNKDNVWIFRGNLSAATEVTGVFTPPETGWYLVSGCAGGSITTSTTGIAIVYRRHVYLIGGDIYPITIGARGSGATANVGTATIIGGVMEIRAGAVNLVGSISSGGFIEASAYSSGFSLDLSQYPYIKQGVNGVSGSIDGSGYGANAYTSGVPGPGLLIIEKAPY
jgi:hypothetical protein